MLLLGGLRAWAEGLSRSWLHEKQNLEGSENQSTAAGVYEYILAGKISDLQPQLKIADNSSVVKTL